MYYGRTKRGGKKQRQPSRPGAAKDGAGPADHAFKRLSPRLWVKFLSSGAILLDCEQQTFFSSSRKIFVRFARGRTSMNLGPGWTKACFFHCSSRMIAAAPRSDAALS